MIAPRLAYRLRYGWWCDHQTRRYQSWMDEVDVAAGNLPAGDAPPDPGWSEWEMWDLGRDKIRHCRRCGHVQTLSGPPLRGWVRDWWTARTQHQRDLALAGASILAGAGATLVGVLAPLMTALATLVVFLVCVVMILTRRTP